EIVRAPSHRPMPGGPGVRWGESGDADSLSPVKVLVVEDAAPIRARMVALLAEVPGVVAVLEAEDVAQATRHLRAAEPGIVVLDLHLRDGESGLPFVRLARHERPRILIVVVTNLPTEQHR